MSHPASSRLVFRSWTGADSELAQALWCDPEVTHFFGGAMKPVEARSRLDAECEREARLGIQYWPMFLRETGEFAGCAGLRPWQFDAATTELGVHLMRAAWGTRLGEEAALAVLALGFEKLKLPVVVAGHGVGHEASRRMLLRVGFRFTHETLWGPKSLQVLQYALDASDWSARKA